MNERSFTIPVLASAILHTSAFLLVRAGAVPKHLAPAVDGAEIAIPFPVPPPEPPEVDPFESSSTHSSGQASVEIPDTPQAPEPGRFQVEPQQTSPNIDLHATIPTMSPNIGPGINDGKAFTNGVIDSRFLDHEPKTRYQRSPMYPSEARHMGISGRVVVEFLVDETGRVSNARVVSSTDPRFEAPTLQAVSAWRFEPGRKDGRPVRFRMQVPVEYNLSEN